MAITGTFLADFNDFYTAVNKAETELRGLESGAGYVETALDKMVESSAADIRQVGTAAQSVNPALTSMGTSADTTGNAMGNLQTSLSQADRALAAMGVRIGPQIGALGELAQASGKTASELGLVTTAGLALAAGMAGWQLGRAISEFFDLDEAIGNATAALLGFGDVAAETAAYKTDILAQASAKAGHAVTTMAEAERVLTAASKAHADQLTSTESRMTRYKEGLDAGEKAAAKLTEAQKALILAGTEAGDSVQKISTELGLNEKAVGAVVDANKKHIASMKEAAAEAEKAAEAVKKLNAAYDKMLSDARNAEGMAQFNDAAAALERQAKNAEQLWMMERDAYQLSVKDKEKGNAEQLAAEKAYMEEYERIAKESFLIVGQAAGAHNAELATTAEAWNGLASAASAVSVAMGAGDWQAYSDSVTKALMNVGTIDWGAGALSPSGTSVVNNFTVNGTGEQVAREVSDYLTRSVMSGRKIGSV